MREWGRRARGRCAAASRSAPGRRIESEELTELERELCAAVVQRVLEEPEDDAEHCVADRRLAEGSAVGAELRQLLAGGVVAVDQRDHRPGRGVLDEARQEAAEDRRPRQ